MAGLKAIPAVVKGTGRRRNDTGGTHREPAERRPESIEEAAKHRKLMDEFDTTQEQLSATLGRAGRQLPTLLDS